jgi:hypothetical protein
MPYAVNVRVDDGWSLVLRLQELVRDFRGVGELAEKLDRTPQNVGFSKNVR